MIYFKTVERCVNALRIELNKIVLEFEKQHLNKWYHILVSFFFIKLHKYSNLFKLLVILNITP